MNIFSMHLGVNISSALQQLESVKSAVDQSNDPKLKVMHYKNVEMPHLQKTPHY